MILVIGDERRWNREGRGPPPGVEALRFVRLDQVAAALRTDPAPDLVLSPLVGAGFDALDLARLLRSLGFAGRYRVVVDALPDPAAVLAELRAEAPGLDVDLVSRAP